MLAPGQRVKANLAGLTIQGVHFSQNVQEAPGKRVDVPEDRLQPA